MTTPIRPGFPQTLPTPQRSTAAVDAQRAFFQAAMQGTAPAQAPAARPPVQAAPVQAPAVARTGAATGAQPEDAPLPRLGRYLDIRV